MRGERKFAPAGGRPHVQVHGSRAVSAGGDVGTERTEHD
jgi:hypothetical protein